MAKYNLARLIPANYPHFHEIGTRFADLDGLGHINNLAMGAFYEDSRTRFLISVELLDPPGVKGVPGVSPGANLMLATQRFDYIAQSFYPAPIIVYTAVGEAGRSSFTALQLTTQNGKLVGLCTATCVLVAGEHSTPLPDAFHARMAPWKYLGEAP